MRQFALLSIAVVAVLRDLREGRIPNRLIVIGLVCGAVWQFAAAGQAGVVLFVGGCVLPVLLFGGLYYFRMFGAGDIKLLCVLGGFLGPMDGFRCIAVSVFFGGCIALAILIAGGGLRERLGYLAGYLFEYAADVPARRDHRPRRMRDGAVRGAGCRAEGAGRRRLRDGEPALYADTGAAAGGSPSAQGGS